jgi:HEAT repeat protein
MLNQESIGNLIKTFHLTITYLKIYPPTSQMVTNTFDALYRDITQILAVQPTLTFSELSGKLLVEGKEAENREVQLIGNNILQLFSLRKIQSITFRPGVAREELMEFINNILRKKRDEIKESPHIALDQTVYVAMVKGEEAVVKISEMIQSSGGDIAGIMKSLRESYDLIDQLPDPSARVRTQDALAQELAKQDATVLREIFERELPRKIEESGLKPKLLSALSKDKIQDIFGDISAWYAEVRKMESSDFAAIEQLERFKKFVRTILSAPAARQMPVQFFEELVRKGLMEQLPEWFSAAPSQPTTVFEVERLLEKPAVTLLETGTLEGLPSLVEKLYQIENAELIGKLVEKLLENLKNPAARIRLPAVQVLAKLYDLLQAHVSENILRFTELPLLEAARQETSSDIHRLLAELLRRRARQNLLHGEYDLTLRIVELFRQHAAPEIMTDETIRESARAEMAELVPEIIEVLIADLKADNDKKRLGSMQILARIGDSAVDPLIRVIKESEDIRGRRLAALALKNLGPAALRRFGTELHLGLPSQEIPRMVEALNELGDPDIVEHLGSLLQYPDATVKKDIIRFLARLNTPQATFHIIEQLKDQDPAVMAEAIHVLGEFRLNEAVPALAKVLSDSRCPLKLKEDICVALGAIAHPDAVPALVAMLGKKPSLFSRQRAETERIRMRAAWALRKFRGREVEAALEKASTEKAAAIAVTAKESLAVLHQPGQKN